MATRNSAHSQKYQEFDPEAGDVSRKRSLVRPERSRIDPSHPYYHYSQVANQESSHIKIQPSSTGLDPTIGTEDQHDNRGSRISNRSSGVPMIPEMDDEGIPLMDMSDEIDSPGSGDLKGGREVYGLNDEIRSNARAANQSPSRKQVISQPINKGVPLQANESNGLDFWKIFCYTVTFWAPAPVMKLFGLPTKERQYAWREKMGLLSFILVIGAIVAFLTFGFTRTVCFTNTHTSVRNNRVNTGSLIINGRTFDLSNSQHPAAVGITAGTNVLYPPINAGGSDASFLFQNVNGNCKGLITARDNCTIPTDGDDLAWYMPCRFVNQDGSSEPNFTTQYYDGYACHTSTSARDAYYGLEYGGDVYFTWDDIKNSSRNLVVYSGVVLDLDLINWIQTTDVEYPDLFRKLRDEDTFKGHDISVVLTSPSERQAARCLTEIVKVGVIDSDTIGCIASKVVLYVSLIFILSVVVSKFVMACYFKWVIARKQGASIIDNKTFAQRERDIEDWTETPTLQGPIGVVPQKMRANYHESRTNRQNIFQKGNRSSLMLGKEFDEYLDNPQALSDNFKYTTMSTQAALLGRNKNKKLGKSNTRPGSTLYLNDQGSSTDLLTTGNRVSSIFNPFETMDDYNVTGLSPDIIQPDVVAQPPVEYQPAGYPLAHAICLVTCYSEDEEGLRTSMDSIATTDFPNSHKLILVICDGLIKGSGNDRTTPEIALSMMTDFSISPEEVQPYSYVAVAQGTKRHNMAKVYSGFYKYDDSTVPTEKQQRVPIITIVKCGTPAEAGAAKPGNRGKRDSQIILMSFLQKVLFDERMTDLEFEMFSNIWRVTGLMTELYEVVLMVDADTKIYPDSLTHMVAEMVRDPTIMGLCGETKIANKRQSWVTAIQVFEYYISHHQAKAFESVFGGVTCLPGCFSMYRIKSPKGNDGYWVPILANPDIVERYSDNVVDSLHKKNLLLLGEDRYLSSLMLRTFPKRKQIFVPKAVCKTVVPDKFSVLLSQRRRWINSTVHNLMELVLVKDLCGTFCFSMQFVIGIELVGTLVLPAAISFTIYVIVVAIISTPTPILSLVLLGIIFGLPGVLIVVTASSWSYVLWMLIYLMALPIWNFVLPVYAYWKFDDFSWGETRTVVGETKGGHESGEGTFDSSDIVMKRWREFERDRRSQESLSMPSAAWDPSAMEKSYLEGNSDYYGVDSPERRMD